LIGRFALFLYPPDALQMSEPDRIRVASHINGEDAPALSHWLPEANGRTVTAFDVEKTGGRMRSILSKAAHHFVRLKEGMAALPEFLAKFADLLMRETNGEIALDGRRLGFLYRNILATRSIELAKAEVLGSGLGSFVESARHAVQSSIPIGLNDAAIKREEALHKMEICFDLLSSYFEEGSALERVNRIYELFTTRDLMRKVEILVAEDLGNLAASKAWNDLINGKDDITLLAYAALQIEARRPGTIPTELLASLSAKITGNRLGTECLPSLAGESIERIEAVEALLDRDTDLGRLIAYERVALLAEKGAISAADIEETRGQIERDIETFEQLVEKGGDRHEDVQAVA